MWLFVRKEEKLDHLSTQRFGAKYARKVQGTRKTKSQLMLGRGSFGKVVLVEEKTSKATRALKIIEKKTTTAFHRGALQTEIHILRECGDHEHILRLFDVYDEKSQVLLVLELATGGDLMHRVSQRPEDVCAATAMTQICQALRYLHTKKVVHRDIKPENILLRDEYSFVLKLADFGCSKILTSSKGTWDDDLPEDALMTSYVGTKAYAAPEILRREPYGPSCDVYSTGVVLALLLIGRHPLSDVAVDTNLALASSDVHHIIDFEGSEWSKVSKDARLLVQAMAQTDPTKRPSPETVLATPWVLLASSENDQTKDSDSNDVIDPEAVASLRQVHLDDLQALVLRFLVVSDDDDDTNSGAMAKLLAKADDLFEKLDADKTGFIRRNELVENDLLRHNDNDVPLFSKDQLHDAFDRVDLDGSGLVDRTELRAALLSQSSSLLASFVERAFKRMDVSKTGLVNAKDVLKVAKSLGSSSRLTLADVQAWINAHDETHNGQLDKSEFATMMNALSFSSSSSSAP